MALQNGLEGVFLPPKSGTARQMVVFLHGYGDSGGGLISIGAEWRDRLPDTVFVAPNAPAPCDMAPFGYQWFALRAIDKREMERDEQIRAPAARLNAFLDAQLKQWGLDDSRLAVLGFSQGAMMALYAMPRRPHPCAAVLAYAGLLIGAADLQAPGAAIVRPPVLLAHGDADDVVPFSCMEEARAGLTAAGFSVTAYARPGLAHGIDPASLAEGLDFIRRAFGLPEKG